MKNRIQDLNDHLFAEIERLGDEDLEGEALDAEVKRAKAMTDVAGRIIDGGRLRLDTWRASAEYGARPSQSPLLGEGEKKP